MATKTLDERVQGLARESFKADIRYKRKFERELEKEIARYRSMTPQLFRDADKGEEPRTILAEGDSWCRYVIGFAVPWHLEKIDRRNHIMNVASPGDTAAEILTGKKRRRLERDIRRGPGINRKFDVILFSGGGNDLLGHGRFRSYLKRYEEDMTAAQVINSHNLRKALDLLEVYYSELVRMRDEYSGQSIIYFNTYDFAQPTGEGVCGLGPWLRPHLVDAGVPDELHEEVVAVFLRRFSNRMTKFAGDMGSNNIVAIRSQGTLVPHEWDNEIHPKKGGFRKIARVFQKQLVADFP